MTAPANINHALKRTPPGVSVWNPQKDIMVVHRAVESVLMLNFYIPVHLISTSLTKQIGNEVRFLLTIDFGVN